MKVRYSPLAQQFAAPDDIFAALRDLVASGDFTLGRPVREFEDSFAELVGTRFAVGVGTGTDALKLSLKALGVGAGDEVITNANTFVATVGAICEAGARPVFVDCDDSFCLDAGLLEAAITPATRAIMPAHLTGDMADMPRLTEIGARRGIAVVEDACQAMLSAFDGRPAGTWGRVAGFSMHPLKLINVWGDGGIVVTDEAELADTLRLLRNHGLRSRDEMAMLGYNTRLDSVQAVVGTWMLPQAAAIARIRAERAAYYDRGFRGLDGIRVPVRNPKVAHTYLLYIVFADERRKKSICAKALAKELQVSSLRMAFLGSVPRSRWRYLNPRSRNHAKSRKMRQRARSGDVVTRIPSSRLSGSMVVCHSSRWPDMTNCWAARDLSSRLSARSAPAAASR